jgi:hypothetical protein
MSDGGFYGGPESSKYSEFYAQARYLCYYLQEKGLLIKFYQELAANVRRDPTGSNRAEDGESADVKRCW